ncbi:MAG: hypothetical protein WAQ98_24745 [Blastocatellia bacterium]
MSIAVKNQTLPTRCEICHQADYFDPNHNYCQRCSEMERKALNFTPINLTQENNSSLSLLLCRIGFHKWYNSRWERCCLRCHTIQHVWRIIDRSIEWRTTNELSNQYTEEELFKALETTPLPLRKWQCWHCNQAVIRIHPPGIFESCLYCGTSNYILREK